MNYLRERKQDISNKNKMNLKKALTFWQCF